MGYMVCPTCYTMGPSDDHVAGNEECVQFLQDRYWKLVKRMEALEELAEIGSACVYGEQEGLWLEPKGNQMERFHELRKALGRE